MARWVTEGRRVVIAYLTDGVGARGAFNGPSEEAANRRSAAQAAARVLGIDELHFGSWPDNRLDSIDLLEVVQHVEALVEEVSPQLVVSHHPGDLNVDHRLAGEAVATACRPLPGSSVRAISSFEVASSTEWRPPGSGQPFVPNLFVDIEQHLAAKLDALACYHEELRVFPHSRSLEAVEALARWRGASVGVAAAEAFVVQRVLL